MHIKDLRLWYRVAVVVGAATVLGTGIVTTLTVVVPPKHPKPVAAADITVTASGSMPKDHHTLRVVSARSDLTGKRELAWVADAGQPVGDARCTQNFHIGPGAPARVRPTLLICWRTSAARSVYTVAVDVDHRPSAKASVEAIDRAWDELG